MKFWEWPIDEVAAPSGALPKFMLTRKAFDAGGALDVATSLILPSGDVASPMEQVTALSGGLAGPDDCLGLWLGRHHPPSPDVLAALGASSLGWVTNFPCASAFGDAFGDQLSEVGTGRAQEVAALSACRAQGKRVMLSTTPGPGALPDLALDAVLLLIRSAEDLKSVAEGFLEQLRKAHGPDVPILVHGGPDGHLPRAPQEQGIAAIMHLPSSRSSSSPSSSHGVSSGYRASSG